MNLFTDIYYTAR